MKQKAAINEALKRNYDAASAKKNIALQGILVLSKYKQKEEEEVM